MRRCIGKAVEVETLLSRDAAKRSSSAHTIQLQGNSFTAMNMLFSSGDGNAVVKLIGTALPLSGRTSSLPCAYYLRRHYL
jgi:hypothetical protein